jgi:hypothetical protein
MAQDLFGSILSGLLVQVLGQFCKSANLVHKDKSIRVFIFKSINTLCKEKMFKLDNTIAVNLVSLRERDSRILLFSNELN